MTEVPIIDDKLWFTMGSHCEGKHYLIGNPHTFPGRMWAWCPNKENTFFVSKGEIEECSIETKYWINGFLAGNEPDAPILNSKAELESKKYKDWLKRVKEFSETGYWNNED